MTRSIVRPQQLRIADLEAFCAVAERLSYVAAARSTSMSPSAVTRAIQSVEAALGRELVSRNHRNVSLTPAGEAYYEIAKSALRQLASAGEVFARSASELQGWVRFSAPPILESRLLPEALAEVAARHPSLHLDITYTDAFVDPAQAGLDFAIRGGYPASSSLIGQTLWRYDRYLCASPAYVERHGFPERPEELDGHSFVIHTGPRLLRDWHLHDGRGTVQVHVDTTHRVNTGSGLTELLLRGVGISRLASWVAQPLLDSGALVRVCPRHTVVSRTGQPAEMHVVYQGHELSGQSRAVIAAVRKAWARWCKSVDGPARKSAV